MPVGVCEVTGQATRQPITTRIPFVITLITVGPRVVLSQTPDHAVPHDENPLVVTDVSPTTAG